MKTNKDIQAAMDRRLSYLNDLPSCRAAVQARIAGEEPVMKKKLSVGLVFAMILVLLSVAALAAGLLLSPRADASRIADRALEETYGVTAEMQTFFAREEEEREDGTVVVTYTGIGQLAYPLGTYTAEVKGSKAALRWSHDGEDTSGGYEAECWGREQLGQMLADCMDEEAKERFLDRAARITGEQGMPGDEDLSGEDEDRGEKTEAEKTAAMEARVLPEEELIGIGREFIIGNYALDEEQISRMELYTNSFTDAENCWYEMVNGQPCLKVEYLLYQEYTTEQMERDEPRGRTQMDGYYIVYVNVENGTVEEYEYNSALGGLG